MRSFLSLVGSVLLLCLPARSPAQASEECLACHGDVALKGQWQKRAGGTITLYVDSTKFSKSIHGSGSCTDCHKDLENKELPHADRLARATCTGCHDDEVQQHEGSIHGSAASRGDVRAPRCSDCHGKHEILPVSDGNSTLLPSRIPALCGTCHKAGAPVQRRGAVPEDSILSNYAERIHGDALITKGLTAAASCISCHGAHEVRRSADALAPTARRNVAATCSQCHGAVADVHREVIPVAHWSGGAQALPVCVDCHEVHEAQGAAYPSDPASRDCLRCHARADLKSSRDGRALSIRPAELRGSVHGRQACVGCHAGLTSAHSRADAAPAPKVECASCHAAVAAQYRGSTHGQLSAKNDGNAPTCVDCHGTHGIPSKRNQSSPTFPTNVPNLCAQCHRTGEKAAVRYQGTERAIVEQYTESIHGTGLIRSGLVVTAMCTSCHTAHGELPASNPRSSVNPKNMPSTCGTCHVGIQEKFERSVHSPKMTATGQNLPVCNDCHSAHTISRHDLQGFKLTIMDRCGKCHQKIAETYFETYHGKVSRLGYTQTAQCYDCHGSHDILEVRNPESRLSPANAVATCRACHPNATKGFTGYLAHATHSDRQRYPWLFWTFWAMTSLLVGTFTFFGAHTLLWLPRSLKLRRELATQHVVPSEHEKEFQRFTRLNRVLHAAMILSFLALAATGMTLKFSYTRWASVLSQLLGGYESAGYIHRFSAVVMIVVFGSHLVDVLARRRRERTSWKDLLLGPNTMMPTLKDVSDFVGNVKWFLGLGERPRFGRWTYWEKFDYFGVFWGMAVIGGTGLLLWFPVFFTRFLPGAILNVATIIHSDEALLATGFIFAIHFFNTHLRPEKFPMDVVIFTGRMSVEELKQDKPAEYDALVSSGELDSHLVEPYQPIVIRTVRAFAWTALAVGVAMILWIIWALLFGHVGHG